MLWAGRCLQSHQPHVHPMACVWLAWPQAESGGAGLGAPRGGLRGTGLCLAPPERACGPQTEHCRVAGYGDGSGFHSERDVLAGFYGLRS